MKRKWIETGQELLIILLNHLVMISFGITAMGLLNQDDHEVWLWSLLLMIPLLYNWVKKRIHNFYLFFALHLAVPVGCLFVPVQIVPKFLMILISIVYFVWSIKIGITGWGHGEAVLGPVLMTVILGVMLLIDTFCNQKGWESIYITIAIIYVAGYFMYAFTSRYLKFLVVNESSAANIPEAEILNNGFGQSFLYMAGVITLLVLTANVRWLSYIDFWIVSRITNIRSKLLGSFVSKIMEIEEGTPITLSTEQVPPDMIEVGEEALSGMSLEKTAIICLALFVVGLTVFGIGKGFRYLWKEFHRDTLKDAKKDNNGIDIREDCTIEKTKKEGNNWFSFLNNREKIRKIYRKQVLNNKTAIIGDLEAEDLEYMTAKECCDKIAAEQLKKRYEKARYSVEEITSDDVKAAKSGINNVSQSVAKTE